MLVTDSLGLLLGFLLGIDVMKGSEQFESFANTSTSASERYVPLNGRNI